MSDAIDRVFVEIEPDFDEFNRMVDTGIRRATRQMEARIRGSLANIEDRFSALGSQITRITGNTFGDMASSAEDAATDIGKSLSEGIGEELENGLKRDVNGRLRDQFGRFVEDGGRSGRNTGKSFGTEFGDGMKDALSTLTGIKLPIAVFGALGAALAAAAASAAQLAAALAPAVGIVAALPAAVGVGAAAIGTLQVATAGFGDAMAAAFEDTEAFDAAIEELSPNAQAAAEAFRAAVPELEALQDAVQDAFFQDMDAAITAAAASLTGPLSEGMSMAAGEAGALVTSLLEVAGSQAGIDFISSSFATLSAVLAQLQEPVANLFTALLELGTAVNTAFGGEEAGAGLAAMIQRFADFISVATESGQAVAWVENARAVFEQIGAILSPIVGIISSIGSAASATGGNILGVFGEALQVFDDFLASAQGQAALVAIFEALNQVGASFGTVLANIAPALVPIISGISEILGVVTPLLGPLSELVGSVLAALAPILNVVAAAITPLIEPLTSILELLGPILIDAINTLMPLVELLANLLGTVLGVALELVATVLEALAPVITSVLEALAPLIEALTPLFDVLALIAELIGVVLQPIIQVLGEILLWLVDTVIIPYLIPAIELLIQILTVVLIAAIEALKLQFEIMGTAIQLVWSTLTDVISQHAEAIASGWNTLVNAFKAGWNLLNNNVFAPIKSGINAVKSVVSAALSSIRANWNSFVGFIQGIPGRIRSSLSSLFSPLASGFKSAINAVISGWNSLSFSIPSVDLGALGSVGGFTISTPNIPYLQTGGFTQAEGLAMLHPDEMVLPLTNSAGISALAAAIQTAGGGSDTGLTQVTVQIGSETITQMVDTQITRNNQTLTRKARAGTGKSS